MAISVPSIGAVGLARRGRTASAAAEASERRDAVRTAVVESLPLLAAITPFGVVIGVTVGETTVHDGAGWAGSLMLFAGSAHLAAVTMLGAGASGLATIAAVIAINARFAVYSASLAPAFQEQPRWFRWLAPHFLLDATFALISKRIADGRSPTWIRWYYLGLAAGLLAVWPAAIAVGVLAGPVIPQGWQLGFAAPALLSGLLVPALNGRPALASAAVGVLVALALAGAPNGIGLLAGGVAGTVAGLTVERTSR